MSGLISSQSAIIAFCYFAVAASIGRLLSVGRVRSLAFAVVNVAAVWLIFFGTTNSGTTTMALYLTIIVGFWILLYLFKKTPGYWFLV